MLASLPNDTSREGLEQVVYADDEDEEFLSGDQTNTTWKLGRMSKTKKSAGDIARAKRRKIKQRLKRTMPFSIGESDHAKVAAQK